MSSHRGSAGIFGALLSGLIAHGRFRGSGAPSVRGGATAIDRHVPRLAIALTLALFLAAATFLALRAAPAADAQGTFPGQGFLPHNRAWEMVSPPDKNGSNVVVSDRRVRVAEDGNALQFASLGVFGDAVGSGVAVDYIARRTAATGTPGWETHAITPPQDALDAIGISLVQRDVGYPHAFSPDLDTGVFYAFRALEDDPATAKYSNLYLRDDLLAPGPGNEQLTLCPGCTDGMAPPLSPPDLPLAQRFPQQVDRSPQPAGFSSDGSVAIFFSPRNLTPGTGTNGNMKLYRWDRSPADEVQLLSVDATAGTFLVSANAATATGDIADGSATVTDVRALAGEFAPGQRITGAGIPAGTTIDTVSVGELTLSAPATSDESDTSLGAREVSDPVDFDATAAELDAALEGLEAIGADSVEVTGGPGGPGGIDPYEIEFTGDLAGADVGRLDTDVSGLTGTAVVTNLDEGGHLHLLRGGNGNTGCPGTAPCSVAGNSYPTSTTPGVAARIDRTLTADGSRVILTSPTTATGGLTNSTGANASKLWVVDSNDTPATSDDVVTQVNAPENPNGTPTARRAQYIGASTGVDEHGDKAPLRVFFISEESLTDEPLAESDLDLFLWDEANPLVAASPACPWTAILATAN